MLLCLITFSTQTAFADEDAVNDTTTEVVDSSSAVADDSATTEVAEEEIVTEEAVEEEEESGLQVLKKKFIEGGAGFMSLPLICLILGLAIAIERIISLFWMSINNDEFVESIEKEVSAGNLDAAKEICRNTRGPVASIFYQGLERSNEGVEMVEKSIIAYGGVQMGLLEKGLSWIGLFIALAPMLGFMGTVIGMIDTFNVIETKGEAEPAELAGVIKVALLTTVSGLIVAMILQVFYNYIVSKIDGLVNQMEDASISMVDILLKHDMKNK